MAEFLLVIICEGGLLESQALACSGSCNRSLYAVCEKMLVPAVQRKRMRLAYGILRATHDKLENDERVDLDMLGRTWRYRRRAPRVANPLRLGIRFCVYQIKEASFAKTDWLASLRVWVGVGPRELHKFSSETLRHWRHLTGQQRHIREILTRGGGRPWHAP
jgi:hypothetical protein